MNMSENRKKGNTIFVFMEDVASNLKLLGKIRTSETYKSSLDSFRKFRKGKDLTFNKFNHEIMIEYEAYLKAKGISKNTSSFYMRTLRAVYNRAVNKGLTLQKYPFKYVYTGIDRTRKRAVSVQTMKQIKSLDLSSEWKLDFARDMFLFSFYTRGMSFVDMSYLRKKDLSNGVLTYRRHKTGQLLHIKWEACMQEIVNKYKNEQSTFLLPIINTNEVEEQRKQYIYYAHNINRCLKKIGAMLGLSLPLTMYVARHTWASIAKQKNVPISVISDGLGHDSELTTRIYLSSMDNIEIDKANKMIMRLL
ncbi:MAG: site-specific integrase [Paludibacteraceae bacterium]|nr:site-specific integrase [Paludibacteraceae bacterium]